MNIAPETIQHFIQEGVRLLSVHGLNIIVAILIFFIGKMVANSLANISKRLLGRANVEETLRNFLRNIVYYTLLTAVVIAALGQAGVNVTSFLAVLGAAGLAVGLALKDSLSNFAAGVMLILLKFFKKDDYVTVAGQSGTVKTINIFNTILTSPDNKEIIVPNSAVLSGTIINVTANDTRRVDLTIGIGYDDDLLKAKEILERIVSEDPRILEDPAPAVKVMELGDSSVNFVVRPWCKTSDYWGLYFTLIEKIKLVFDQEGISIPYPQTDVHLYKADQ